jgi:transcriptional regulator
MEKYFECYAENGLTGTGIKALAAACGCTTGNLMFEQNTNLL